MSICSMNWPLLANALPIQANDISNNKSRLLIPSIVNRPPIKDLEKRQTPGHFKMSLHVRFQAIKLCGFDKTQCDFETFF